MTTRNYAMPSRSQAVPYPCHSMLCRICLIQSLPFHFVSSHSIPFPFTAPKSVLFRFCSGHASPVHAVPHRLFTCCYSSASRLQSVPPGSSRSLPCHATSILSVQLRPIPPQFPALPFHIVAAQFQPFPCHSLSTRLLAIPCPLATVRFVTFPSLICTVHFFLTSLPGHTIRFTALATRNMSYPLPIPAVTLRSLPPRAHHLASQLCPFHSLRVQSSLCLIVSVLRPSSAVHISLLSAASACSRPAPMASPGSARPPPRT